MLHFRGANKGGHNIQSMAVGLLAGLEESARETVQQWELETGLKATRTLVWKISSRLLLE